MPDRILGCHTDTTVHLNCFLTDLMRGATDRQLRSRRDGRIDHSVGDGHGGVQTHAARQFERHVHVGRTMSQRLELREWNTELLALLQVFRRQSQSLGHDSDRLGAQSCLRPNLCFDDRLRDIAALTKLFGRGIGERELRTATAVVSCVFAP